MVESLIPPPIIEIDMNTFGESRTVPNNVFNKTHLFKNTLFQLKLPTKEICFGCAATNSICRISGKTFNKNNIFSVQTRAEFIGTDKNFLKTFEEAIDNLRYGRLNSYNMLADKIGIVNIKKNGYLKPLFNDYKKEDLNCYIKLANSQ